MHACAQRAALKLQQLKKKDVIEGDKATEEKISTAIAGRTAVAVQGSKDLSAFVSAVSSLETASSKTAAALSGLFAQVRKMFLEKYVLRLPPPCRGCSCRQEKKSL